jgi:hypothetical protein
MGSDAMEKFSRRQGLDPEAARSSEISQVMRDDHAGATGYRQLYQHVVIGIFEQRPPQEMDGHRLPDPREVVQDRVDVRLVDDQLRLVTEQDLLVLEHQRDREAELESFLPDKLEDPKRSP